MDHILTLSYWLVSTVFLLVETLQKSRAFVVYSTGHVRSRYSIGCDQIIKSTGP